MGPLIKGGIPPPPGPMKGFRGESDDKKTIDILGTFGGHPGEAKTYIPLDDQGTPGEASITCGVLGVYLQKLPALLARKEWGNRG